MKTFFRESFMLTLSVRGASDVRGNTPDAVIEAVTALVDAVERRNGLSESDLTLILFSVTSDITALNPAAALRRSGRYASVPLFCTQEPVYDGSLPMTVRVLIQFAADKKRPLFPVYLGKTSVLRPDLTAGNS